MDEEEKRADDLDVFYHQGELCSWKLLIYDIKLQVDQFDGMYSTLTLVSLWLKILKCDHSNEITDQYFPVMIFIFTCMLCVDWFVWAVSCFILGVRTCETHG